MEFTDRKPSRSSKVTAKAPIRLFAEKYAPGELFDSEVLDLLEVALKLMVKAEGVLMIGTAQGGKGVVVTTWVEGERQKGYVKNAEELKTILDQLIAHWESVVEVE